MNTDKPAYLVASTLLPEGHASLAAYCEACYPIFLTYGAEVLIAGTSSQILELVEGCWPNQEAKLSLVKFPSMQHLKDCWNSDEYQAIKHLRTDIVKTNFSLAVD
ncbi:DUF1330 domain-containing protein [Photobacterium sagamiensis]|uniref:DUF1330 domain-containing protein n=1 Tax=Photobacterium sagamiensis TaxID=2910241 RepID=UPI003D1402E1